MFDWLPEFLQPEYARVIAGIAAGAILLGFVALIAALASYARVLSWQTTGARIIASEPGFEVRQRFHNEAARNERVAKVAYEFKVAGETYRSGRFLDSGHPPEDQVDRILSQYPKGAAVIVHYNPRDPRQSALEINRPPRDLALGCLSAILIVVVFAALAIWLFGDGVAQLRALMPDALLQAFIPTLLLGIVFIVCFVVGHRRAAAIHAWPQTTGTVTSTDVHHYSIRSDGSGTGRRRRRYSAAYMPIVEYRYEAGGREHLSRSIWADTEVSGSQDYARKLVARYPTGSQVMVYYDPQQPSRSALERAGRTHWLFLLGAAVALTAAAISSGFVL